MKIGPAGSIAFDSAPGFFVAAFYSPWLGAVVAAAGHLGSAATGGMPFGLLHIAVAFAMAIISLIFGLLARSGKSILFLIGAAIVAVVLNGFALPLILVPFGLPQTVAFTLMPVLAGASAVNVALASVAAWTSAKFRPGA